MKDERYKIDRNCKFDYIDQVDNFGKNLVIELFDFFGGGGGGGNYAIHNGFTVLVSNWLNSYTSRTRLNNTQNSKVIQHLLSESQQNREYRLMGFNPSSAIVGSLKIKQYEIISFFHFKK